MNAALATISPKSLSGARAAQFDTRFRMAQLLTGSAAASAAKMPKRSEIQFTKDPESFFVTRSNPPALEPGELERATSWAAGLVAQHER